MSKPPPFIHWHECVGDPGHMGVCCCDCAEYWEDPEHGMGNGLRREPIKWLGLEFRDQADLDRARADLGERLDRIAKAEDAARAAPRIRHI